MVRILIANRERYESNGMDWLLKSSDLSLRIEQANTGKELLKKLEECPIDLLILELELLSLADQDKVIKSLKVLRPIIIGLTIESTFETAMKAIDLGVRKLLLKPVLPEQLQKHVQAIVREFKSRDTKETTIMKKPKIIELNQLFNDDVTCSKGLVYLGFKTEQPTNLSKFYNYVKEYSFGLDCDIYSLADMIIGISSDNNQFWKDECNRLLNDWQLVHEDPISIVVFFSSIEKLTIHQRYLETKKMLDVPFFVGFNKVLTFNDKIDWKVIDPFLSPSELRLWVDFLNQSNLTEVRRWLYSEFLQLSPPFPDPGLIRIRLTSILAQLRRYLKGNTVFLKLESDYLNLFNQVLCSINVYRNIEELILFIAKIFDLKEEGMNTQKDIIDSANAYIKAHYWDPQLTLVELANVFNLNSSYLSTLFVQRTGKTFKKLLNETRILHAKRLLIETELDIKEVSILCGYSHQQYFTKVFRESTSQTPKQFRSHFTY